MKKNKEDGSYSEANENKTIKQKSKII